MFAVTILIFVFNFEEKVESSHWCFGTFSLKHIKLKNPLKLKFQQVNVSLRNNAFNFFWF